MQYRQRVATWATGMGLVAVTVVFSIPVAYGQAYWPIAFLELGVLLVAAWFAGASQLFGANDGRRRQAIAGLLLIAPFALFALLPGLGPPDSLADNGIEARRFTVLLVNALLVCGGCFVLRDLLADEGGRLWSTLAISAAAMSAPLYVVFTAIQLADYRGLERQGVGAAQQGFSTLDDVSIVLLFFGSALNYLAAIGFAQALFRVGALTRRARTIHVLVAAAALSFLIFRGLDYGSLPRALQHWYTTVAFFAGVPAISWVLLSSLGVVMLSRAGRAPAPNA